MYDCPVCHGKRFVTAVMPVGRFAVDKEKDPRGYQDVMTDFHICQTCGVTLQSKILTGTGVFVEDRGSWTEKDWLEHNKETPYDHKG